MRVTARTFATILILLSLAQCRHAAVDTIGMRGHAAGDMSGMRGHAEENTIGMRGHAEENTIGMRVDLGAIEKEIAAYTPDSRFPDDPFIFVTVKEALKGGRERNGGIGACLVREATGEILEQTHNRQYEPYFRSDLHAEMDLLDRYEERVRITRSRDPGSPTFRDPRNMSGLILYTSVEPCPMCLTRMINAGVKKAYYAAPDEAGGMVRRFDNLPPFWKGMGRAMVMEPARCSPELKAIAQRLFRPMFMQKGTGG